MSPPLGFRYWPSQFWRPSGVNIEFDPSQANTAQQQQRALIIGQMLPSGTATPNVPVMAFSRRQVNDLCGANSMLAMMYAAYIAQDAFGEVWIGPVLDASIGSTANGAVTLTGTATDVGTLALYVMGFLIPVPVALGDTATIIAAAAAAIITAQLALPVSASASGGVLTLTAIHKGAAMNDVDLRVNYLGAQAGEVVPPGITVSFSHPVAGTVAGTLTGGATNPTLDTLLANCGTELFDFIALPYSDNTSLTALKAFLSDQTGRWSAVEMLYGHVFYAVRGTVSTRSTFGNTRNDQHASCLGYFDSPTPAWLEAADWCGAHAVRIRVNPAQGVALQALGMLAPPVASRDTPGERNTLLFDGMSTYVVTPDGTCHIDRSVTTYQFNAAGQPDDSYLNTNLLFQAAFVARYLNIQITSQFIVPGKILVANGTPIGPGSPATTPNMVLGAVNAIYAYLCTQFVVQNPEIFAQQSTAQSGTKGQVLLYLPLDFSDQVINVGILAQFRQTT